MWENFAEKAKNADPFDVVKSYILRAGKYSGVALEYLHEADPGYLLWLSANDFGESSLAAKRYLELVDSD